MALPQKISLSIVIPLYNEEGGVRALFTALNALVAKLPKNTEVILVDDGSTDNTFLELKKEKLMYLKSILRFSRNFGHQAAILAGLEVAKGQVVLTMDGDLQHPPEMIPKMLAEHAKGINIVLTKRIDTKATAAFKRVTSILFYRAINLISDTPLEPNASDFRSLDRQALNQLLAMPERRKFLRGMVQWIGFSSITLSFQVKKRQVGESKYTFLKMLRLALFGLSSFSTVPLYFSILFSMVLFVSAVLYAIYVVYIRFILDTAVSGWASVVFVTLVIGGGLSLFVGLLGMYVAAIYDEVKGRPLYVVQSHTRQSR